MGFMINYVNEFKLDKHFIIYLLSSYICLTTQMLTKYGMACRCDNFTDIIITSAGSLKSRVM